VSTPYRNEIDALRERQSALKAELSRLREQTTQLDELRARESALAGELGEVEGRLNAGTQKRTLPLLDQVRIASPCKAEWSDMLGDERVRFCLGCEKNVYNLSSMTRDAAEDLLRERLGNELCVRFYQRADGTILTQDCPEGVKKKRRKKLVLAVAGAGAMAAAAATMFMRSACRQGEPSSMGGAVAYEPSTISEATMGDVAPTPTVVPSTMGSAAVPHRASPMMGAPQDFPMKPVPTTATTAQPPLKKMMGKPVMGR